MCSSDLVKKLPTYEYECNCCSSRFERKQSFSDSDPVSCPLCGSKTQRIFSPVPIIFKGSGFYVTDSRNSNSHALALSESSVDKAKTSSVDKAKNSISDKAKASSTDVAKDSHTNSAKAGGNNGAKSGSTEKDS